jgi:hypothetical protein
MKGGMVINNKPTISGHHMPLYIKKETVRNNIR